MTTAFQRGAFQQNAFQIDIQADITPETWDGTTILMPGPRGPGLGRKRYNEILAEQEAKRAAAQAAQEQAIREAYERAYAVWSEKRARVMARRAAEDAAALERQRSMLLR